MEKKTFQFFLVACIFFACNPSTKAQSGLIVASDSYAEASSANLYVVKPDGTDKCYVTNDTNWNRNAGWSYDGTRIVYEINNSMGGIWTMDANGNNKNQLMTLPSHAFGPAFSPDGTHIVYSDYGAGETPGGLTGIEVFVMNSDGTNKRQLTKTTVNGLTRSGITIRWSCRPAYSPDGSKIVYACTQSGRTQIWVMNADTTNKIQLTDSGYTTAPDANFASFSPDGSKIAFLGGYETEYGNIWVMNANGTGRTQLTFQPDSVSSDEPAWSGDGNYIMFDSNRYDSTLQRRADQTWVMNADGSNPRVLFSHLYGEGRNPWRNDPVQSGGQTFQCTAASIENISQPSYFQLYPNPANETLYITFSENQKMQIQIFDAIGMLMKEIPATQSLQIDISDLAAGLYFICFRNHPEQAQKFIKQ